MRIGIEAKAFFRDELHAQGLAQMKALGFDCLEYQNFVNTDREPLFQLNDHAFDERLRREGELAAEMGVEIFQTHGPWRYPPQDASEEDRQERFDKMVRSLHGTRMLGSRYCVIHPIMPFGEGSPQDDADAFMAINEDFFTRLVREAEREQVVICLENMPMRRLPLALPEEIAAFVRRIGSPWLRVCLDTGHCAVRGVPLYDAVHQIGAEYLRTLHVHDNNGLSDQHSYPFSGVCDWDGFSRALREIGYDGCVSLECRVRMTMPEPMLEHFRRGYAMTALHIAGRRG